MEDKRCYVSECMAHVECACPWSSLAVYACELHAKNHLDKDGKAHDNLTSNNLRDKRTEAGNKPNKAELEQESKIAHSAFKKDQSSQNSPSLIQAYQDNALTHHQQISLYNLRSKDNWTTTLLIYNTDIEAKEEKIIETPETLDRGTCMTQLPSGKLFCYGKWYYSPSGITLIIDKSGGVEVLPSGTPSLYSSAIYFSNNVYCFGGGHSNNGLSTLSSRFDLDRNEWIELAPLPKADVGCNSIMFNGDILISGFKNINLVRYSIGSNSFTTIPYQFAEYKRKILIYGERLYLIECDESASMYESEIGSGTAWRRIGNSTIRFWPEQTYCSYNKGEAFIGCTYGNEIYYFRFNFTNKSLMKIPE